VAKDDKSSSGTKEYKPTEEEQTAIEAAEIGFLAFCQTLPPEAVVTDHGVYASRTDQLIAERERERAANQDGGDAA
jgi:hypothetical protein